MFRRPNRKVAPAQARGLMNYGPIRTQCPSFAPLQIRRCVVNDPSGHIDCCGSKYCIELLKLVHYFFLWSLFIPCVLRLPSRSAVLLYVQTYLELSFLKSLAVAPLFVARATGSRGVPGCRSGLRPFSVALVFVCVCSRDFIVMVLLECFTFLPAQWALPQLNGPVQNRLDNLAKTVY